jgi:hypothetical protein
MGFEFECLELMDYEGMMDLWRKKKPLIILTELSDKNIKILDEDLFVIPIIKHVNRTLATKYANRDFIILDPLTRNFRRVFMKILLMHSDKKSVKKLLSKKGIARNIVYGYGFEWGRSFVVNIKDEEKIYRILPEIVKDDIHLFVAVRDRPEVLEGLSNTKVVWVTDIIGKDRIKPHNLTILTDSIIRFIEEKENAIILIDCIEYLLLYNDFINILRNIELINSYVMEHNAILIIIIDNNAYTKKEYSLLRRYAMEWIGV